MAPVSVATCARWMWAATWMRPIRVATCRRPCATPTCATTPAAACRPSRACSSRCAPDTAAMRSRRGSNTRSFTRGKGLVIQPLLPVVDYARTSAIRFNEGQGTGALVGAAAAWRASAWAPACRCSGPSRATTASASPACPRGLAEGAGRFAGALQHRLCCGPGPGVWCQQPGRGRAGAGLEPGRDQSCQRAPVDHGRLRG